MKVQFSLNPHPALADRLHPLVFDWDEETGEVSGPGADYIKRIANGKGTLIHPYPGYYDFSSNNPLKDRGDMAAILGFEYQLPDVLVSFYPKLEGTRSDVDVDY